MAAMRAYVVNDDVVVMVVVVERKDGCRMANKREVRSAVDDEVVVLSHDMLGK